MIRIPVLLAGIGLVITGGLKSLTHNQTTDPFKAFWCHSSELASTAGGEFHLLGHCWGCYAAVLGAALITMCALTAAPQALQSVQARSR